MQTVPNELDHLHQLTHISTDRSESHQVEIN